MKSLRFALLIALMLLIVPLSLSQEATPEATEEAGPLIGFWEECATPMNLSGTIRMGAIFALSGSAAVYGTVQQNAIDLALEEINAQGYLGEGVTLEVVYGDSASTAEQATTAMTNLIEEQDVVAILGPTLSSEAFSADPVAQEAGIPVMGVSNTAIGITDMGEFVFRNSLPEAAVIPGVIAQATEILGLEQVGVLYGNDDDFTLSGYDVFVEALTENEVEILGEETFAKGDADFSAQLTNLIAGEPDALVVSALAAEGAQIIIQARELGYNGPIIGGNGFNAPSVLTNAGEDAEGLIVGAAWNATSENQSPSSVAFAAAYEEAFGSAPDQFAAQAYTGAWLMATAIRCADSTEGLAIRDALAAITDFNSPLGVFSFDENRDPVHEPVAQIVIDGKFEVLTSENAMMDEE
ncbi:MAG: ABC transporter substrate-binding protein [Anaerolineae bacterium]|jgi:branched-chain amino acid transport system substrate-binding protein|nr:ABC transporter substrate-binding protein [Anaerolineae bacterium]